MIEWVDAVELVTLLGAVWWVARWTQRAELRMADHRKRIEALEAVVAEEDDEKPKEGPYR